VPSRSQGDPAEERKAEEREEPGEKEGENSSKMTWKKGVNDVGRALKMATRRRRRGLETLVGRGRGRRGSRGRRGRRGRRERRAGDVKDVENSVVRSP